MGSSYTQLRRQEEARSIWHCCWHKNSLHSAMSLSIVIRKYASSSVLKYMSPISMAHLAASAGAPLPILISSLSLPIISCHKYCVIMACWNMIPGWQSALINRSFCQPVEKKRWSCELRQSGHANCCGVRCHAHTAEPLRQLRSINSCGSLDKTPRKYAHNTVQEPSIINNLCNYIPYLNH